MAKLHVKIVWQNCMAKLHGKIAWQNLHGKIAWQNCMVKIAWQKLHGKIAWQNCMAKLHGKKPNFARINARQICTTEVHSKIECKMTPQNYLTK